MGPRVFAVQDSFVVRGRGTVITGPRQSDVGRTISVGDRIRFTLADGRSVESTVAGIEQFLGGIPQPDPIVGILLAHDVGKVASGTPVYPAP
jgi:translation elongation factor EF-Tu-like GTPase